MCRRIPKLCTCKVVHGVTWINIVFMPKMHGRVFKTQNQSDKRLAIKFIRIDLTKHSSLCNYFL